MVKWLNGLLVLASVNNDCFTAKTITLYYSGRGLIYRKSKYVQTKMSAKTKLVVSSYFFEFCTYFCNGSGAVSPRK